MKCPKCGYSSFSYLDECKRCSAYLIEFKMKHNIWGVKPANVNFLYMEEVEEGPPEEVPEAGELEMDLSDLGLEEELILTAGETAAVSEAESLEGGNGLGALDFGELEPVTGPAEGEEAGQAAPVADVAGVEEEIDLGDLSADLGEVAAEEAEGGGEVPEEEVLVASGEVDLSDVAEDLSLDEVLEEVAAGEPETEGLPATELKEPTEDDVLEASVLLDEAPAALEEGPEVQEEVMAMAEPPPEGRIEGEEAEEEPEAVERALGLHDDLLKEVGEAKEGAAAVVEEGIPAPEEVGPPEEEMLKEETLGVDLADITEKAEEEPEAERAVPAVDLGGLDEDETETPRAGPAVDLSALEDLDAHDVEVVKEEEEPAEERGGETEAPSGDIEATGDEIAFELDEDRPEKKEEDEEDKGGPPAEWY